MSKKVIVVLAEGFETIEAMAPVDILRRANLDVVVVGLSGLCATSAQGVTVQADVLLSDIDYTPDALILPGGMPGSVNLGASQTLGELCRRTFDKGALVGAICAAPAEALAKFGILSGRRATCFPGCEVKFPSDALFCEESVCVDGNLITSLGAGTALAFAYALVEWLVDATAARTLEQRMVFKG